MIARQAATAQKHSGNRYKKKAIPTAVRREVALRYGCPPGGSVSVACAYCPAVADIHWWPKYDGTPGYWVWFGHELHHVHPEFLGGPTTADNLVLACRKCNRSRGTKV